MKGILKIGDTVQWRGGWGRDTPKKAIITSIELTRGGKNGDEVSWGEVSERNVVVDLDNGHWAYGEQLKEIKE